MGEIDAIFERARPVRGRQWQSPTLKAVPPKPKSAKPAPAPRRRKPDAAPVVAATPAIALPPLPQVDIDVPFTAEFDPAPLLAAAFGPTERDGRWFGLRESFARLGLAQGFDELLCLPHVVGVEPLTHQIETVRKVLKQFRGRVLLADEVGLGKTIEAGMVLKEYTLRGMAERTLVLTPASLVGQWQEELAAKFGLDFAITYDPLLRDEPHAFWAQDRIIASIATARRREQAERLA